jgi:site-specific recombinase XerD
LVRFDNHLAQVHGLTDYSRNNYVRYARRLAQTLPLNSADWTALDAHHISEYVRREASRLKAGSCRQMATAMRAILRFLVAEGVAFSQPSSSYSGSSGVAARVSSAIHFE